MPQLRFLEPHEVEKLLAVPRLRADTGMRNRVIMQLMWETGMRVGEVLALRPRDVLLSKNKVTIQRGKGGKTRVVYWRSEELSMLIGKWRERRPKSKLLFPTVRSESGKGSAIEPMVFQDAVRPVRRGRGASKVGHPSRSQALVRHGFPEPRWQY